MGITNRGKYGLQIGAGQGITNRGKRITKRGRSKDYKSGQKDYKTGQGLQNGAKGLQIGAGITKRGRDYKSVQHNCQFDQQKINYCFRDMFNGSESVNKVIFFVGQ